MKGSNLRSQARYTGATISLNRWASFPKRTRFFLKCATNLAHEKLKNEVLYDSSIVHVLKVGCIRWFFCACPLREDCLHGRSRSQTGRDNRAPKLAKNSRHGRRKSSQSGQERLHDSDQSAEDLPPAQRVPRSDRKVFRQGRARRGRRTAQLRSR